MKRDEAMGGIVVFLFGAVTACLSLPMSIGSLRSPGSGMFPLVLGVLLMLLSGAHVMRVLLLDRKGNGKKVGASWIPGSAGQVIFFVGAIAAATLLLKPLGYPLVSFLLLVALLRILGMKRWPKNLFISFMVTVACYFLFVQWLMIPLPKGWLGL